MSCGEPIDPRESYTYGFVEGAMSVASKLVVNNPSAPPNGANAIAIIDSVISPGWFMADRAKMYDALVAIRQLLQNSTNKVGI